LKSEGRNKAIPKALILVAWEVHKRGQLIKNEL
jgi:hypothetical protein